jgi:hypothetical protein
MADQFSGANTSTAYPLCVPCAFPHVDTQAQRYCACEGSNHVEKVQGFHSCRLNRGKQFLLFCEICNRPTWFICRLCKTCPPNIRYCYLSNRESKGGTHSFNHVSAFQQACPPHVIPINLNISVCNSTQCVCIPIWSRSLRLTGS